LQLRVRHIARNVIFNWLGTLVNMTVGLFLSPFILHRLGNIAFGIWVLAIAAIGYLSLLDFGMQNSVLRFVSKGYTQKDHSTASEVLSAALWVRLQIFSVGLAVAFPHMFKVPPQFVRDAREAVLLIGATAAISMSLGVLGGVISALNRYDLQTGVSLIQTAIRVVGVVSVLRHGHGIVAIAACELVAALVGNILLVIIARRLYPELRIYLRKPKFEVLKKIWSYSFYVFITGIAVQLITQTDNMVVGAFVSTSAVTFYAIANNLIRYTTQVVNALGGTFVPAASTYEAAGDSASLLMLYKNGTRATLVVSLPIVITLLVRGRTFIGLWMGPQYSHISGTVLIILGSSLLFGFANRTPGAIAFGIEKHKVVALFGIGEGVANLVLSITLVHWYGMYGVAVGTLIPSLVIHLLFWPGYISKLVGLSAFEVVGGVWAPVMLAAIPFAAASYAVERLSPPHNLAAFFLQVAALVPIFLLTIALVFRSYIRSQVLPRVQTFLAVAK
jgi:O-antigen/teichoic acid export membrane protein